MKLFSTLNSGGQLPLPSAIRRALNIQPGDRVGFRQLHSGAFLIEPIRALDESSLDVKPAVSANDVRRLRREANAARGLRALRGTEPGEQLD